MLFEADITIDDEPAAFYGAVIVSAPDRKIARQLVSKAAIDRYYEMAGGWALKPKVTIESLKPYKLPEQGVVMVSLGGGI